MESHTLQQRMNRAIPFLSTYQRRQVPGLQTPDQTLLKQSVVCRELAFPARDVAKQLGLASLLARGDSDTRQLHHRR